MMKEIERFKKLAETLDSYSADYSDVDVDNNLFYFFIGKAVAFCYAAHFLRKEIELYEKENAERL